MTRNDYFLFPTLTAWSNRRRGLFDFSLDFFYKAANYVYPAKFFLFVAIDPIYLFFTSFLSVQTVH